MLIASAPAAASIKPHKLVVPMYSLAMPAMDGADVYWVSAKKVKQGKTFRYEALLNRSSLINRSRVRLARFGADGFVVASVMAGGGQVVVNLEAGGVNSPLDTRVVRMSRDGSRQQVLASGSKPGWDQESVVEGGRARPSDCGTYVHAQSASATGSVVLMQTRAERESSTCGGKPNIDHLRVTEVALTGATREIYNDDIPLDVSETLEWDAGTGSGNVAYPDFPESPYVNGWKAKIQIVGDRAIYVKLPGGPAYVRDLNTGALAGPYGTGLRGPATFNFPTLDPSGRVAMAAISQRTRKTKDPLAPPSSWFAFRSGVFDTPINPTPFTHLREFRSIHFCGSRLIAATADAFVELDPKTFRVQRQVVKIPDSQRAWGLSDECNDKYLYVLRPWNPTITVLGFPLG